MSCEHHSCCRGQAHFQHPHLGSTSTATCCASSTSNSSPPDIGRGSFYTTCSCHGSSRRLAPATGRVRLTLPENANSCSCASSTCAIASEARRVACGTWTRQLCAWFHPASPGGQKSRVSPCLRLALTANMRGGMWTQIVYEKKTDRVRPHGPIFPRQLVSYTPTHWITQDALLDMIDAIDADMNALVTPSSGTAQRTHSRWTERTCEPSRTRSAARWPNTSPSSSWKPSPTSNVSIWTPPIRCSENADSPQHRTAGWRFIDWKEVEQRELLAEAKRLLETGQPRSLTRQMPTPKPETASQRRT